MSGLGGVGRGAIDPGAGQVEAGEPATAAAAPAAAGAKPELKSLTTERIARTAVQRDGNVAVSIGIGGGFSGGGGRVGLSIDGRDFIVDTRRGDDLIEAVETLKKKIQDGGYKLTETRRPAIDTFMATWAIEKAAAPPPVRLPEKVETAARREDHERFPELGNQPDRQFVAVAGAKRSGRGYEVTLATYRTSIAGPRPGHQGEIPETRRTYKVSADGTKVEHLSGPGGAGPGTLGLKSLTTDRIARMQVRGDEVRVGVGIGAGMTGTGGAVGLEIEGKKFSVKTPRGSDVLEKLETLEKKIEAAGYEVTVEHLRAIDTYEAVWKIKKAGQPQPGRVQDLGLLGAPGETLGGKTYALKPGDTIRFETNENQITGMGDFKVDPAGALTIERKVIRPRPPGMLGGATGYEWRITVPPGARPGAVVKLASAPNFQVRDNPRWKFGFEVKVK